jgi:predicted transcriptional regulator
MPAFELAIPKLNNDQAKSIKELYNAYIETTQKLQWLLTHLDDKNVLRAKEALIAKLYAGEITTDQIVAGNAKISLALIEDIVAQNIVTNTFVTQTLYASKADIAELTVDRLETSDKVARYKTSDTSDMNFVRIKDQNYDFITAHTNGSTTQLVSRGQNVYWTNAEQTAVTFEATAFPVTVYAYTEQVKMSISFTYDSGAGTYIPKIVMGLGTGSGDNGKAFIYKNTTGLLLRYITEGGVTRDFEIGESGITGVTAKFA